MELLLARENDFINTPGRIIKLNDPCAAAGGMLAIGKERIERPKPTAKVYPYGQEVNPETYAVCKAGLALSKALRDAILPSFFGPFWPLISVFQGMAEEFKNKMTRL